MFQIRLELMILSTYFWLCAGVNQKELEFLRHYFSVFLFSEKVKKQSFYG